MRETEVLDYADNSELVNDQLMGLAGGIMDLMEDKNPNASGVVEMSAPEVVAEEVEAEEPVAEAEAAPPKADKYVIKWEGEDKEVDHAELLELAQKGFDYTRKTQKLAQEKSELSPFIGLANKIKGDPILASQIAQLMSGQKVAAPVAEEPVSDDPVEQLKAEIKKEIRAEMEQKLAPMGKQQILDRVKMQVQTDPMFADVQQDIVNMVKSQPQALQRNMFIQLDQDPEAYMQAFKHFKKIRQSNTGETVAVPKPVSSKTKAPIIESSGSVSSPSPRVNSKEQKAAMNKKKDKALRSGDTQELANWLLDSGALEHLY